MGNRYKSMQWICDPEVNTFRRNKNFERQIISFLVCECEYEEEIMVRLTYLFVGISTLYGLFSVDVQFLGKLLIVISIFSMFHCFLLFLFIFMFSHLLVHILWLQVFLSNTNNSYTVIWFKRIMQSRFELKQLLVRLNIYTFLSLVGRLQWNDFVKESLKSPRRKAKSSTLSCFAHASW